jgi:hypothetical protein
MSVKWKVVDIRMAVWYSRGGAPPLCLSFGSDNNRQTSQDIHSTIRLQSPDFLLTKNRPEQVMTGTSLDLANLTQNLFLLAVKMLPPASSSFNVNKEMVSRITLQTSSMVTVGVVTTMHGYWSWFCSGNTEQIKLGLSLGECKEIRSKGSAWN